MKIKLITIVLIFALFGTTIGSASIEDLIGISIEDLDANTAETWAYAITGTEGNGAGAYGTADASSTEDNVDASTTAESTSGDDASVYSDANGDDVSLTAGATVEGPDEVGATGDAYVTGDVAGTDAGASAENGDYYNSASAWASAHGIGDASGYAWAHAWG